MFCRERHFVYTTIFSKMCHDESLVEIAHASYKRLYRSPVDTSVLQNSMVSLGHFGHARYSLFHLYTPFKLTHAFTHLRLQDEHRNRNGHEKDRRRIEQARSQTVAQNGHDTLWFRNVCGAAECGARRRRFAPRLLLLSRLCYQWKAHHLPLVQSPCWLVVCYRFGESTLNTCLDSRLHFGRCAPATTPVGHTPAQHPESRLHFCGLLRRAQHQQRNGRTNHLAQPTSSKTMQALLQRGGTVASEQLKFLINTPQTDDPQHNYTLASSNTSSPLQSSDEESGGSRSSQEDKRSMNAGTSNGNESASKANSAKALSSCILYCFCSVSMILVNKSLSTRYGALPFVTNRRPLTMMHESLSCSFRLQLQRVPSSQNKCQYFSGCCASRCCCR